MDWGWQPKRAQGIWRHGAEWMRPFVSAVPYVTVGLLLLMFHVIGGTLTLTKGILFDLPANGIGEGEVTDMVAMVMPMRHETILFFDDSRYILNDVASVRAFGEHLAERTGNSNKTLLVLADSRVAGGDLMKLAGIARSNGVAKILFAEKRAEVQE